MPSPTDHPLHVVVYRTGGYASFTWRRVLNRLSIDAAKRTAEEMRDMGYRALVLTEAEFAEKGIPTTWEADEYFSPGVVVDLNYEDPYEKMKKWGDR